MNTNDELELEIETLEDKIIHLEHTIDELKQKIHKYEAGVGMKQYDYDPNRYRGLQHYFATMVQAQSLQSGAAITQAANNHHAHQLAMYNMEQRMYQPQHQSVLYPPQISPEPQANVTEPSPESTIMRAVNYFRNR